MVKRHASLSTLWWVCKAKVLYFDKSHFHHPPGGPPPDNISRVPVYKRALHYTKEKISKQIKKAEFPPVAIKTIIYGEGIDKGDKALYKAYTGAIKYYLANTFLIATGNEPENDGPGGLTVKELQSFILEYMKAKGKVASKQEQQIKKLSLKQITELVRNSIIKNNQNGGNLHD